jgi:hypothetical protein
MRTQKFLGYETPQLCVDGGKPFFLGLDGVSASYNGHQLDLQFNTQFNFHRERPGDDHFLALQLASGSNLNLLLNCGITIERISPSSIEIQVDSERPIALWVNPRTIRVGDEVTDFTKTGLFTYQRTSGESPRVATLVLPTRAVKIPFTKTLDFTWMGVVRVLDPNFRPRFGTVYTRDRLSAYKAQKAGLMAMHPKPVDGSAPKPWDPIELTADEKLEREADRVAKRQAEFEKNCGC